MLASMPPGRVQISHLPDMWYSTPLQPMVFSHNDWQALRLAKPLGKRQKNIDAAAAEWVFHGFPYVLHDFIFSDGFPIVFPDLVSQMLINSLHHKLCTVKNLPKTASHVCSGPSRIHCEVGS